MSLCDTQLYTDKLRTFAQLSESIEQSLELAKRGTDQIKSELELLKQIHSFHHEYDLLSDALKARPKTRSEVVAFKKELFNLVRRRIQLLRSFHIHCEDFKMDMKLMRQLQASNDLEYEISDVDSDCEEADGKCMTLQCTYPSEDENAEEDESTVLVLERPSLCTTYV